MILFKSHKLMPADEFTYYLTGEYVGDPYDDVLLADGEIVYAANSLEEAEAKNELSESIESAKNYLLSHQLDFSDEWSADSPNYIHAANIVIEMEQKLGIPTYDGYSSNLNVSRSVGECFLEATGIQSLYDGWYGKFATKRMLIAAVGKVATRFLGYVGAVIAVADFSYCMWG